MTTDPTWQNIQSLAEFATQASGADGFAVYELDDAGSPLVRFADGVLAGSTVPDGFTLSSYPLRFEDAISGVITFAFRGHAVDAKKLGILERLTQAIESVYQLPRSTAWLVRKISTLEAELAGIKITERTLGMLANGALD